MAKAMSTIAEELQEIKANRIDKKIHFKREKKLAFHKTIDECSEDRAKKVLRDAYLDEAISITSSRLLMKKRNRIAEDFESADMFAELAEISLLARAIDKDDSQIFVQEIMAEYTRMNGRKKTFSDIKMEFSDGSDKRIWEGKTGRAALTGLFLKIRSKMKSAKNDGQKFKALADMIALSAMFNHSGIQDVFRAMKKMDENGEHDED